MKKILIIIFLFSFYKVAFSQNVIINPSTNNPGIGEEFYIDVVLDTDGKAINALEGEFIYDSELVEVNRFDNSKSIISYWIEQNLNKLGQFSFAGVIPNGFSGYINKPDEENQGNIFRVYITPKNPGVSVLTFRKISFTENDGLGTIRNIDPVSSLVDIKNEVINKKIEINDITKPILDASIIKNDLLYSGSKTLIFNAVDKDSGIEGVYLKTVDGFIKIQSPHLLESLEYRGILTIKAVDFAGNETVVRFIAHDIKNLWILIGLIIFVLVFVFYKKNVFKIKNKNK